MSNMAYTKIKGLSGVMTGGAFLCAYRFDEDLGKRDGYDVALPLVMTVQPVLHELNEKSTNDS